MRELLSATKGDPGPRLTRSFEAALRDAGARRISSDDEQSLEAVVIEGREALIVNRVLPDGSAWTAVAALRADQSAIRVRFITGRWSQGSVLEIPTPCPTSQLEALRPKIENLVMQAPRSLARRLAFAGMLLDRLIRGAWCDGQAMRLSPTEYSRFEEFMIATDEVAVPLTKPAPNPG